MVKHRRICKKQKTLSTSSEQDPDREKIGPRTEAGPKVDLKEDLELEDSEDSDGGVIVEEDFITL